MTRILFVKGDPQTSDLLWLDRLCNGLIGWSKSRGLSMTEKSLICVVPELSLIQRAYLWLDAGNFPWKQIPVGNADGDETFWAGDFSKAELKEGERIFPKLQAWSSPPEPRLEGGVPV